MKHRSPFVTLVTGQPLIIRPRRKLIIYACPLQALLVVNGLPPSATDPSTSCVRQLLQQPRTVDIIMNYEQ